MELCCLAYSVVGLSLQLFSLLFLYTMNSRTQAYRRPQNMQLCEYGVFVDSNSASQWQGGRSLPGASCQKVAGGRVAEATRGRGSA